MLGRQEPFIAVPFFWTEQHGVALAYVGYAANWDRIEIEGKMTAHDFTATYWRGERKLAVVTLGRDLESLRSELEFEHAAAAACGAAPS
jgi:3-phenylpropionate/trans-cinnamate dioxygenase ferredoxin reductase subunit